MRSIAIMLPGEPVAWARTRIYTQSGRPTFFNTRARTSYRTALRWEAKRAMRGALRILSPVHVLCIVSVSIPSSWPKAMQEWAEKGWVRPSGRPDLDNYVKMAMDALSTVVLADDAQVVSLEATKRYSIKPALFIEVRELEDARNSELEQVAEPSQRPEQSPLGQALSEYPSKRKVGRTKRRAEGTISLAAANRGRKDRRAPK